MSAMLPADMTSHTWLLVVKYAEARIAVLTETCTSPQSSHEQRANAAHRIEELRELLSAPQHAKAVTQHRRANQSTEMY